MVSTWSLVQMRPRNCLFTFPNMADSCAHIRSIGSRRVTGHANWVTTVTVNDQLEQLLLLNHGNECHSNSKSYCG